MYLTGKINNHPSNAPLLPGLTKALCRAHSLQAAAPPPGAQAMPLHSILAEFQPSSLPKPSMSS